MLTPRDHELIEALVLMVRLFSHRQIAEHWWSGETANARRRLKALTKDGLLQPVTVTARTLPPIEEPVVVWQPGGPAPDFGKVAYRLQERWRRQAVRQIRAYTATDKAARKCDGDIQARRPIREFQQLLNDKRFRLVVVTSSAHKAAAIRTALDQHLWPAGLVQPVYALVMHGRRARLRTVWEALVSWLAYNWQGADLPGTFHSPAGAWRTRIVATGVCVFLIAMTNARLPVLFLLTHTYLVRGSIEKFQARLQQDDAVSLTWLLDSVAGFLLLVLANVTFPVALAVLTPLMLTLPLLFEAARFRSTGVTASHWQNLVKEVRQSHNAIDRNSVYMGQVAADGSPLLVPRSIFREHAHFLGDTGSGKTSLGLAPLIEQLITYGDCSVVVIDLKGDTMELMGTLSAGIEQLKSRGHGPVPIKHFTNQPKKNTFGFNPLLQPFWQDLDLYMRTDIQCGALGLSYGADYGEGFYSSANAAVLYHTIKTFPDATSYRELAQRIGYVVANARRTELHPEIARLVTYSLLAAATQSSRKRQVFLVIDEF